jgi:hypothetical protein
VPNFVERKIALIVAELPIVGAGGGDVEPTVLGVPAPKNVSRARRRARCSIAGS